MFDRQAFFDRAVLGIVEHGFSIKENSFGTLPQCMYRAPNGAKCAVGWSIPDELYEERFEFLIPQLQIDLEARGKWDANNPINIDSAELCTVIGITTSDEQRFVRTIQAIHDETALEDLNETKKMAMFVLKCRRFARREGLNMPDLTNLGRDKMVVACEKEA